MQHHMSCNSFSKYLNSPSNTPAPSSDAGRPLVRSLDLDTGVDRSDDPSNGDSRDPGAETRGCACFAPRGHGRCHGCLPDAAAAGAVAVVAFAVAQCSQCGRLCVLGLQACLDAIVVDQAV